MGGREGSGMEWVGGGKGGNWEVGGKRGSGEVGERERKSGK